MSAIVPEKGSSAFQPQEGFDFPALIAEMVDALRAGLEAIDIEHAATAGDHPASPTRRSDRDSRPG